MSTRTRVPSPPPTTCLGGGRSPACSRQTRTQQPPRLVRPGQLQPLQLPSSVTRAQAAALFLAASFQGGSRCREERGDDSGGGDVQSTKQAPHSNSLSFSTSGAAGQGAIRSTVKKASHHLGPRLMLAGG